VNQIEPIRLLNEAATAAKEAHCPYSNYRVGAALLSCEGQVFAGCNVENASYGLTVCAERVALVCAVAAGHKKFTALAIAASGDALPYPCGACRQVMTEFCGSSFPVYAAPIERLVEYKVLTLGELLPQAFVHP